MPFILVNNQALPFCLRRSARVKRLQLVLKEAIFEVVAPKRVSNQAILAFIFQHRAWMLRHVKKIPADSCSSIVPRASLECGQKITFRSDCLTLEIKYGASFQTVQHNERLRVVVPWQTRCDALPEQIKKQILMWYQERTHELIQASLNRFCPRVGRWPNGFRVKQQKTRWGSCGIGTRMININWRLVLAPVGVLEYVVAHELAHLFYGGHGKRFWAKVAECFPEYREYKQWLSRYGQSLSVIKISKQ